MDYLDQFTRHIRTGENLDAAYEIFEKGREGLVAQLNFSDVAAVAYRFQKAEMDSELREFLEIAERVLTEEDVHNFGVTFRLLMSAQELREE